MRYFRGLLIAALILALALSSVPFGFAAAEAVISSEAINTDKPPVKPTGVTLNHTGTLSLDKGSTLQLEATLSPEGALSTLKWSSSKKKIASVDSNGLVTANAEGKAKITVKTSNGKKASVTIEVSDPAKPVGVTIRARLLWERAQRFNSRRR